MKANQYWLEEHIYSSANDVDNSFWFAEQNPFCSAILDETKWKAFDEIFILTPYQTDEDSI